MDYEAYYYQNEYKKLNERLDAELEEIKQVKAAERAELEKQRAVEDEQPEPAEHKEPAHDAIQAKIDKYRGVK